MSDETCPSCEKSHVELTDPELRCPVDKLELKIYSMDVHGGERHWLYSCWRCAGRYLRKEPLPVMG